jgi:hypothetical protein
VPPLQSAPLPRRVPLPRSAPRGGVLAVGAVAVPGIEWAPRVDRRRRTAAATAGTPLSRRALRYIRTLPDHPMLDRIVRGRLWIGVLGFLLAGIVAMQVEMLKLGANIGTTTAQTATLQARNDALHVSLANLSNDRRIETEAHQFGMIMPGPTEIGFVPAKGGLKKALSNIHAPDTATFAADSSANGKVTTSADGTTYSAAPSTGYTP